MGFFEQIRKLNVDGYAKGGKTSSSGSSSKSDKDKTSMSASDKASGRKSSASRDSGGGGFFGFTSVRDMFDGGGPGASRESSAPSRVSGSSGSMRVPTPRPQTASIMTGSGRQDVSFQDYADIARNPSGARAQALDYVSPRPLPSLDPQFESAINDYMQPREPSLLERGLRMMPLGGILGGFADFTRSTIQDQLTTPMNYYEGTAGPGILSGLGRFATRPGANVDSYTPVLNENGQLVGSMALDAQGNPVSYTGTRTTNATFGDPRVDRDAALAMISPFQDTGGGGGLPQQALSMVDPCPDGYTFDETTRSCVPDTTAPTDFTPSNPTPAPAPTLAPPPAPNYTPMQPVQAPTLTPGNLSFATNPVQPITIGAQQGLGSFRPGNP